MTKPKLPWLKMVVYLPFAIVNMGVGAFFIWMPFLFPIGLALWVLAAAPYVRWLSQKIHADIAYAERDRPLDEDEELPWEGEAEVSEDEVMEIILNRTGRGSQSDD